MAKRKSIKYSKRSRRTKRGYKKESITQLAYKMGLVNRGLKNPDSLVSEAYKRGVEKSERTRKTLF